MSSNLNPEKALIFRMVHIHNLPWILRHGNLFARNASQQDPNYVNIGITELIAKRSRHSVPIAPGGVLSDYVAFYFTPFSMMMYNITTGYGGVTRRQKSEIIIFVSSVHLLVEHRLPFVFTNGHAYMQEAEYFNQVEDLDKIDWNLLQSRNFKRDPNDFSKQFRYQAEALVHRHVPIHAVRAIACYSDEVKHELEAQLQEYNTKLEIKVLPNFYF